MDLNLLRTLTHDVDFEDAFPEDFCKQLYEHKCYYLLSKIKNENTYTKLLKERTLLNRIYISQRFHSCSTLFHDLERDNIPYAVIKGAVLSDSMYGNPYIRLSGDIDLLVSHQHIDQIKTLMLENDFKQGRVTPKGFEPFTRRELLFQSTMSHQLAPFIKKTSSALCPFVNVDINFDIMWGEYQQKTNIEFVLQLKEMTEICNVSVIKLIPEMEFISLCMHHYKDMNSIFLLAQGSLKLGLFSDLYHYLKNVKINQDILIDLCNKLNVTHYVYYCLYYTNLIFDLNRYNTLITKLKTSEGERLLNCYGLNIEEQQTWTIDFFERLFENTLHEYFHQHLSPELLRKIVINKQFM